MSHEPSEGWIDRRVRAAMRGDLDALRMSVAAMQAALTEMQAQTADLRAAVQAMGAEISNRAADAEANLVALREAIDRDERIEALRLRVEGLFAQHRWDTDQLRQALAAIAERLPLGD
jgi:hypothetical protein